MNYGREFSRSQLYRQAERAGAAENATVTGLLEKALEAGGLDCGEVADLMREIILSTQVQTLRDTAAAGLTQGTPLQA